MCPLDDDDDDGGGSTGNGGGCSSSSSSHNNTCILNLSVNVLIKDTIFMKTLWVLVWLWRSNLWQPALQSSALVLTSHAEVNNKRKS